MVASLRSVPVMKMMQQMAMQMCPMVYIIVRAMVLLKLFDFIALFAYIGVNYYDFNIVFINSQFLRVIFVGRLCRGS